MTTRQTPDAVREAVARIVDPKAWEDHDYWASRLRGEGDWPTAPEKVAMMRRSYERRMPLRVAESFRRTDAILAALDSRAGDAGEVEEQAEDWLDARAAPGHSRDRDYGADDMIDAYIAGRSATPAPAVDAVPAGEVDRLRNALQDAREALVEVRGGLMIYDGQVGDPKNPAGWTDSEGYEAFMEATRAYQAIDAALSHGEGRK